MSFGSNRPALTQQTDVNTLERQTWRERRDYNFMTQRPLTSLSFGIFNWTVIGTRFHMEQISVVASHRDHSSKVNGQTRLLRVLRYSSISSVCHSSCFTLSFKTSIDSRFTYYFVAFLDARRHGSRLARKDSAWGRWELDWHEFDLFVVRSEHIPCWDAFMLKCLRDLATGLSSIVSHRIPRGGLKEKHGEAQSTEELRLCKHRGGNLGSRAPRK